MQEAIALVACPPRRSITETIVCFGVVLAGKPSGTLIYTELGYVGKLPLPSAGAITLHGVSPSSLRAKLALANKDWAKQAELRACDIERETVAATSAG